MTTGSMRWRVFPNYKMKFRHSAQSFTRYLINLQKHGTTTHRSDALRDRQSVLDAELQQLRNVLRSSSLTIPKPRKGMVGIGSRVVLQNGAAHLVAGDWTPRAGQNWQGAIVINCNTPLAQQIIGKKVGAVIKVGHITTHIEEVQ
jgi:transcription elongation GreA/GreB family factor